MAINTIKLTRFAIVSHYDHSLIFVDKGRSLTGASLLTLLANIRLGCKWQTLTDTLANKIGLFIGTVTYSFTSKYYTGVLITAVKKFIVLPQSNKI
jgi:hypothetical protein